MSNPAIEQALAVLAMQERIEQLERDVTFYMRFKDMYDDLMESTMRHNADMMGGVLNLALTPGVIEACAANRDSILKDYP